MARGGRSEKAILNDEIMDLSQLDNSVFYRNNSGQAWQGRRLDVAPGGTIRVEPGMVILAEARPITFGMVGSGDIMGAWCGKPVAVEVKDENGRQREEQRYFERAWVKAGGLYILTRERGSARQQLFDAVLT